MQELLKNYYQGITTEDLVLLYQQEKNEDILQEIIRRNKGLLHIWVRRYNNIPYQSEEDLLEEGLVALWKAVDTYNSEKGVAFTTYLKNVVCQHYNRIYYIETRSKRFNGSEPASYEALEEIHREGFIEFTLLEDLAVREFIDSLEGRLQEVAVCLAIGYSKSDIARSFEIKPSSVTHYVKRLQELSAKHFGIRAPQSSVQAV